MRDIGEWLERIGLGQYRTVFARHDIAFDILGSLTDRDLQELGLSLGNRRRLLRAIAEVGEAAASPAPARETAERRNLTVMFCDLVGSTALSTRLDPEDLASIIRQYQDAVAAIIARFGGFVARYMGDGVLVYFGWPIASEDNAERAVAAGLQTVAAVRGLNAGPETLDVRIGIATGLVVVGALIGEGASLEQSVTGAVPNLAARLQSVAAPGAVVISAATQALVSGSFVLDALSPSRLKGWDEPIPVWRVLDENRAMLRFAARPNAASLLGRQPDLQFLAACWSRAVQGRGHVVVLSGEAGIGKSRTAAAFAASIAGTAHQRVTFQCLPHHTSDALHPIVRHIETAAGFAPIDPPGSRAEKLAGWLAERGETNAEALALIGTLIGLPAERLPPPPDADPQRRKQRTIAVLLDLIAGLAGQDPLLVLLEDAHWIDPTTLELFERLVDGVGAWSVLLIVTCRPELSPFAGARESVTVRTLTRLNRFESGGVIRQVAGGKDLPQELFEQIQAKTDGVPLFIEELTKVVLESGALAQAPDRWLLRGPLAPLNIPATLQDSLMARLDRLGWAKELAQVAAVLGRDFARPVLSAVTDYPPGRLREGLQRLIDSELVFRRDHTAATAFSFKHALVQDAAYSSLLHRERRRLHRRIADVLQALFPDIADTQPEVVAHHLTKAQLHAQAIAWWQRAGQRNVHASANVEAIAHFRRCLTLLATLPENAQRDALELDIRIALGVPLMGTGGYTAPEFQANTGRALEICEHHGENEQLYPVLWGQVARTFSSGDVTSARALSERFLHSAERQENRQLRMIGHRLCGMTLFGAGELETARWHLERSLALYEHEPDAPLAYVYGADQRVATLAYLGRTLQLLGYPAQGLRLAERSLAEAQPFDHANTTIYAQGCLLELHMMRREPAALLAKAADIGRLAQGHAARNYQLVALTFDHVMMLLNGGGGASLTGIGRGIGELRDLNWIYWVTRLCLLAAEAAAQTGHVVQARAWFEEARGLIEGLGQGVCVPDLHHIHSELLRAEGAPGEAVVESLRRAIAAARTQRARWSELRSATRLARLLCEQGRLPEAAGALAPLLALFTEGNDLPDVVAANQLLDSLHAPA